MATKTHLKRFNAQRAARTAFACKDGKEGVDFETFKTKGGWDFRAVTPSDAAGHNADAPVQTDNAPPADMPAFLRKSLLANIAPDAPVGPTETATAAVIENATDPVLKLVAEHFGADASTEQPGTVAAMRAAYAAGAASVATRGRKASPRAASGEPNKREVVAALLQRPEGATRKDILDATGWPSVSVPATAKASGLSLRQEKVKGNPTRYYGEPLPAA